MTSSSPTASSFRCADAARERADPLLGTAPTAVAYLLIEHPGPWRFDALAGTGWSSALIDAVTVAVRQTRSRVLLIRRPGRQPAATELAWGVVRVGLGSRWARWRVEEDLFAAAQALHEIADPSLDAEHSELSTEPLLLVCAHGVHDTCCAIRGRPVAATLARTWPASTWECSHVGGDRFAANVVVLPDGTYYGGLDADSAPEVVADHLAGRLDADHLRGSVRWPPVAQVAVGEIHRRFGPYGAADVRPVRRTELGPGRWLVEVRDPTGTGHRVEVAAESRPAAVLTCAAARPTSATHYRVVGVRDDA